MTFSICAREQYECGGETPTRYGVAVTSANPGIGVFTPIAHEWYDDLRIDASETALADLRESYELGYRYRTEASEDR